MEPAAAATTTRQSISRNRKRSGTRRPVLSNSSTKEKSETFLTFESFKAKVEKESGMPIKILRSDPGEQQSSKKLLAEIVKWSIHVLNRSPTFSVQNQTPEEAWSGRRPSVEHFRIFGCIAYAHVPYPKRNKLDEKEEKCIFLGVCEQSKVYKLYNLITKKVVINREVFNEVEFWNHENCKSEQRIQVDFEDGDEVIGQQVETNDEAIVIQEISPVDAVERPQQVKKGLVGCKTMW
ncbi:hypothetical protein Sango_1872300 [Sesamum angolense]|uniref:Retroviral polymerase SH3-like domain-containing protein n=1 Tax=Sesamum angolense TaxID=2727404 RepID=A0AAE1WIF1_9LAMI|nr:hypothetical protein Sango_1872300 [Sesamum angolense]